MKNDLFSKGNFNFVIRQSCPAGFKSFIIAINRFIYNTITFMLQFISVACILK